MLIKSGYSQKEIKIGDRIIKPVLVDTLKFNLFDTWKVIYRTYVAEREHTYEIMPLEKLNPEYYKMRKEQGELIYGSYVHFDEKLYIPYCPYLPSLIINPKYRKLYMETNDIRGYDPRIQNLKLLAISVLCPLYPNPDAQEEFGLFVLTPDIICILDNNAYTYLERVISMDEKRMTWKVDNDGFYIIDFMGSGETQFIYNDSIKKNLNIIFKINDGESFKYNGIYNLLSPNCNESVAKAQRLFPPKGSFYSFEGEIPLYNLKSPIINIFGSTENQNAKWQIKWRLE
jgi:hypothetical protein